MQVVAPSLVYNNFYGVAQAYLDGVYLQRQTGMPCRNATRLIPIEALGGIERQSFSVSI
jgi:hypothetical protein